MPKGQAAISWTPENDAKLLLTIVSCAGIQVDYSEVAKAFGPDVPASCIQTRIRNLRKKATGMGMTVEESPSKSNKRAAAGEITSSNKKAKNVDIVSTDQKIEPSTPSKQAKSTTNGPAKARATPRKLVKHDYKKLGDPFASIDITEDSEEKIFEVEKTESEDSADTGFTPINKEFALKVKTEI